MDYLYAFLGGLLCKAYDDFNDNHMIGSHVQELLKGSQWILLTLLSYNDFNFALVNYVINALNALINSIFGVIFGVYLGVSPSLVKISCYATGYFLFSSGFQTYLLTRSPVT